MQRLFFLLLFLIVGLLTAPPVYAAYSIPIPIISNFPFPSPVITSTPPAYFKPSPMPIITSGPSYPYPEPKITPIRITGIPIVTSAPDQIENLNKKISELQKKNEELSAKIDRLDKTLTALTNWLRSRFPSFPLSK